MTDVHTHTSTPERPALGPSQGLPQAAAVLAYAGALPLIIGAIVLWARPAGDAARVAELMAFYGGLLVAFFGGVRWGVAVMRPDGPSFGALLGGVAPLLVAAPIFLLEDLRLRFALILIALPLLLWDDLRATRRGSGAPDWYLGVRAPLTILMLASVAIGFLRILTIA